MPSCRARCTPIDDDVQKTLALSAICAKRYAPCCMLQQSSSVFPRRGGVKERGVKWATFQSRHLAATHPAPTCSSIGARCRLSDVPTRAVPEIIYLDIEPAPHSASIQQNPASHPMPNHLYAVLHMYEMLNAPLTAASVRGGITSAEKKSTSVREAANALGNGAHLDWELYASPRVFLPSDGLQRRQMQGRGRLVIRC